MSAFLSAFGAVVLIVRRSLRQHALSTAITVISARFGWSSEEICT